MTDNDIIKALGCCGSETTIMTCGDCPLLDVGKPDCHFLNAKKALDLVNRQKAEIERLQAFKSYFDELYGKGLEVANWYLNGNTEPFDNFYESALEEMTEGV